MVKGLVTYTLFLIVTDAFFCLIINLVQGSPYSLIIISLIVRAVCLFILFPTIATIAFLVIKNKESNLPLIVTTLMIYTVLPVIIFALKDDHKRLLEVYAELHAQYYLFSLIFLPYFIASLICLVLANKLKFF